MTEGSKKALATKLAKVMDYKRVFGTEQGQRVLYDMMQAHHILRPMMSRGARGEDLIYAEGERNAVLRILTILKVNPEQLMAKMKENE